jgi:hypothetical protein
MEQKFKLKDFRNLYRILYLLERDKDKILSNDTSPSFIYFDKWLKGHLAEDVDTSLDWAEIIQKRNVNNDEKAIEEFFHFLRIFKNSRFTTRTLIINAASRSYSLNRWIKKYGNLALKDTFLQDLTKIRWRQLSNSTSIWIDFLNECNNEIDGDWYLNEQKANEALTEEFGPLGNDWFNENITNN